MTTRACEACDKKIKREAIAGFNYTEEWCGPYCDTCWFFVKQIETLHNKVEALEGKVKRIKK